MVWAAGLALLLSAWVISRRRMRVVDTPRSRCAAVFVGFNHVEGAVVSMLASPAHFSREVAAWWSATLEDEWQVVTEVVNRDAEGRVTSRTLQTHYEFRIQASWSSQPWFAIQDETGLIRVDAADADVQAPMRHDQQGGARHGGIFGAGPGSRRTGVTRQREYRLHDGDRVFCLGQANPDATGADLVIDGAGGDEFLVTVAAASCVASNRRLGAWALAGSGMAIPVATAGSLGWGLVRALIVAAIVVSWSVVVIWNRLVRVKELQQRAWSLIEVQLSRRAALIPQLVECAKGYASHETSLLEQLARDRSVAVPGWQALSERYPHLRADTVFQTVFAELRDTETRIAGSREYFNETVTLVRDRVGTFPGLLLVPFAKAHRFGAMQPIIAGEEERQAVDVRRQLGVPAAAGAESPAG